MSEINIAPLSDTPQIRAALSAMLIEVVANGASVSFMHPLAQEDADNFWEGSLAAAAKGKRIVLGAFDGEILIGTFTLVLDLPPNQPHRGELAKLIIRISHRGRGVGTALMLEAERLAIARGRTLLVLDTAVDGGPWQMYEGLGYKLAGIIPGYALKPHGGLMGAKIYWKQIGGE
ncbi:MAG: GNAT family N-acetyltransferase [Alphaproteobacteria bacterium]|nr:GNAT family N-acetyltransferase [Alphaproteobacteria bacterium]